MAQSSLQEVLATEPVFALTSDMDWASEDCIQLLLETFADYPFKPTFFLTHASRVVAEAARENRIDLGIHPNFLPQSSHGDDPQGVVAHVMKIVPDACGSRAHSYASSTHIINALVKAGIGYDSGPVLFLQQNLVPLRHGAGLIHLPVFWEDDCHWESGKPWRFDLMREQFQQPGLKIIDVHPFFQALNVPDAEFYQKHKSHIQTLTREQALAMRYKMEGCASFTQDLLRFLGEVPSRVYTLNQLCDWAQKDSKA